MMTSAWFATSCLEFLKLVGTCHHQTKQAYDWDEFMTIPGCASGFCHPDPPEMREQKKSAD